MKFRKTDHPRIETATDWLAELGGAEPGPAEKAALTDWLRESPRNVRDFLELTLLDQDLRATPLEPQQVREWVKEVRDLAPTPITTAHDTRSSRAHKVAATPEATSRGMSTRSKLRTWGIAASLALAVVMGAGYLQWQHGRYATGFGEQRILTLEDGSVVTLNTSSTLRVDFSGNRRELQLLEGEAFFRVAHDATRPFDVTARDATVRALGTQFNVRVGSQGTLVSVVDGIVEVRDRAQEQSSGSSAAPEQRLRLREGEEAKVAAIDVQVAAVAVPAVRISKTAHAAPMRAVAWTRGRVEFDGTPLIDVLSEFQRYRELEVSIAEPLRQLKLTGSFDAHDPESALAYIATLPGVSVETLSANHFLIRQK